MVYCSKANTLGVALKFFINSIVKLLFGVVLSFSILHAKKNPAPSKTKEVGYKGFMNRTWNLQLNVGEASWLKIDANFEFLTSKTFALGFLFGVERTRVQNRRIVEVNAISVYPRFYWEPEEEKKFFLRDSNLYVLPLLSFKKGLEFEKFGGQDPGKRVSVLELAIITGIIRYFRNDFTFDIGFGLNSKWYFSEIKETLEAGFSIRLAIGYGQ